VNIVIMLRNIETITSDIQTKLSVVTGQVDALSRSAEEVKQRYLQANNDSKDVKKKKAEVQNMPARTRIEVKLAFLVGRKYHINHGIWQRIWSARIEFSSIHDINVHRQRYRMNGRYECRLHISFGDVCGTDFTHL
jgi:hypothetical protein